MQYDICLNDLTISQLIIYLFMLECLCNSCNMNMRDLPDICLKPARAEDIHIKQIMSAHATSNM